MTLLSLRDVSFRYGSDAVLDSVDIEVAAGEFVGLIGPNGAGKSTLVRLIAGEIEPDRGAVVVDGRLASEQAALDLARVRAVLPQHPTLEFGFTCLDVVKMGRYPHRESGEESKEHAMRAMELSGTADLAQRRFTTLSVGEQARVAFARVLAQSTPIVIVDEPTASLDLQHQLGLMSVLRGIADDGAAVLGVLHDVNLAAQFVDRVVVLDGGSVEADGSPQDVVTVELIKRVYGVDATLIEHPRSGRPVILPTAGETS